MANLPDGSSSAGCSKYFCFGSKMSKAIAKLEQDVNALQATIEEQPALIASLQETIAAQAASIASLQETTTARDQTIKQQDQMIKQQAAFIDSLQKQLQQQPPPYAQASLDRPPNLYSSRSLPGVEKGAGQKDATYEERQESVYKNSLSFLMSVGQESDEGSQTAGIHDGQDGEAS